MIYLYFFFKVDKLERNSKDKNGGNIENDTQHELNSTDKVCKFYSVIVLGCKYFVKLNFFFPVNLD